MTKIPLKRAFNEFAVCNKLLALSDPENDHFYEHYHLLESPTSVHADL